MTHTTAKPTRAAAATAPATQPVPTPAASDDIVQDMLSVVMALAPEFTQALAERADAELRQRWGGDRPYIARRRGEGSSARNARIKADYLRGERISYLSRHYELSERRILQILKE